MIGMLRIEPGGRPTTWWEAHLVGRGLGGFLLTISIVAAIIFYDAVTAANDMNEVTDPKRSDRHFRTK